MSDRFDVYQAVLEDTGRYQQRFDATVNSNRALLLSALGTAVSGATGIMTGAVLALSSTSPSSAGGPTGVALYLTGIISLALCIFGLLFSRYLGHYVRRSLEVLRVRHDWLKQAETAPELTALGADLFSYEADHIKQHGQVIEGLGPAQERFVRAMTRVFALTAAAVCLGSLLLLTGPYWSSTVHLLLPH